MDNPEKLILLFGLLLPAVFQIASGTNLDDGTNDYEDYNDMNQPPPAYDDHHPTGNNTLTEEIIQYIIKEAVDEARYQILNDPELKSLIRVKIEQAQTDILNCIKKEGHYYDIGVPDCKDCNRGNCEEDELCRTECRGFFERAELKQKTGRNQQEIEAISSEVAELQSNRVQDDQSDQSWHIAFAVLIGISALVTIFLIYLVVTRTRPRETERLTSPSHPLSDILAEGRRLLGFGRGNGDGPDGNQA